MPVPRDYNNSYVTCADWWTQRMCYNTVPVAVATEYLRSRMKRVCGLKLVVLLQQV